MNHTKDNSPLFTDLYALTAAQTLLKNSKREDRAIFNLFFRKAPFNGDYAILSGIEDAIKFVDEYWFSDSDIEYLSCLNLFDDEFLKYLKEIDRLDVTIECIGEGSVVFPMLPLVKVTGNLIHCQLIETALLNIINFNTLISTNACRIKNVIGKDKKLAEFGMRRAQGMDGALSASKAAYIGGADFTSNVLAGKMFGIPVVGTHSHAYVMSYESEFDAFYQYLINNPENNALLIDTYNVSQGIEKAVSAAKRSKVKLKGVRIDSGDLSELSKYTRERLNYHKFYDTKIIVSDDLNEEKIRILLQKDSPIDAFGVGTNLVTGGEHSALGGVYKLSLINNRPVMKFSETKSKSTIPGDYVPMRRISHYVNEKGNITEDKLFLNNSDKEKDFYFPLYFTTMKNGKNLITDCRPITYLKESCDIQKEQFNHVINGYGGHSVELSDELQNRISNARFNKLGD